MPFLQRRPHNSASTVHQGHSSVASFVRRLPFAFPTLLFVLALVCGAAFSTPPLKLKGGDSSASAAVPAKVLVPEDATSVGELIEETGFYQSIRLTEEPPIYRKQSKYQLIEVYRSPYYGKVLVLDGVVQLTERDADSYNEMIAHTPMFRHPKPRRVLVVGGGDGYVLSEVLKHKSVEHVDHVDLDGDIIETAKLHFGWSQAWNDARVQLHVADGAAFVRKAPTGFYDVVIQDSSDPWTWGEDGEKVVLPSSVLYSEEHFANIFRILKPNGVLNLQAETLQIPSDLNGIREWRRQALDVGFAEARYGSIMISSYPTGQIGFLLCDKNPSAVSTPADIEERFACMVKAGGGTSFYHPPLQDSSFVLPLWAEKHVYDYEYDPSPSCSEKQPPPQRQE